jgi:hypothetical protein
MLYSNQQDEEEDYLSKILGMFSSKPMNQPMGSEYMQAPVQQISSPSIELLKSNNAIYGDATDYDPITGKLDNGNFPFTPQQRQKNAFPSREPQSVEPLPSRYSTKTNMLAPYGTGISKLPMAKEDVVSQSEDTLERPMVATMFPVTEPQAEQKNQPQQGNTKGIFDSISNTFKDISKSASETFRNDSFREGLGGILVGIGAGIQGQDASKALERYNNFLLGNKEEERRKVAEEERRQKANPASTWNLTYREMFKKYVPGVERLMGDAFNGMTEEMLKSSYPMISDGIKKMTDRELSDPNSGSSKDSVASYNEMISSFGGAVKPLEVGKYSAKQVEDMKGNLNNVLRFYDNERDLKEKALTREQQATQKSLDRQLERDLKKEDLGFKREQLYLEKKDADRRFGLEVQKFNEAKRRSQEAAARANKMMELRMSGGGGGVFSEKEKAKMAIQYPLGLALQPAETSKITKMGSAYNKMQQALNVLENTIKKYGSPVNPSANGYMQIESAWGSYMTALKDAEEMGALDGGVIKSAKSVLPKPTDLNVFMRLRGEGNVTKSTLNVLSDIKNKYKDNFALNTAMYGYNPNIGAGENVRLMDEFIDSNTPDERKKQIFSRYSQLGFTPDTFSVYADNYETRRKPILGVR